HVRHSIFSCLPGGSGCYLILQTGSPEPREEVRYVAERNCYHNLNFFWTHYPPRPLAPDFQRNSFADFLQQLKDTEGKDERSEVLDSTVNPWEKSNPLASLDVEKDAFRLKGDLPQLWEETRNQMIGVLTGVAGPLYPESRTRPKKPSPVVRKG